MPPASESTDELLLRPVARGSDDAARAALEALYERNAEPVLRFTKGLGNDAATAEDILQDVFVSIAAHAGDFRGGSARGWLLAIAGNRSRELMRQRARRHGREAARARAHDPATRPIDGLEHHDEVAATLAGLLPPQRAALELRLGHGLPFGEVAHVLGVSLRTAKNWVSSALAHARRSGGTNP